MCWNSENRGKLKISSEWPKTVIRNFGRWKSTIFCWEKVNLWKFSTEFENFFGNRGGNLKQEGTHHCLRGDGRPCPEVSSLHRSTMVTVSYTNANCDTAPNSDNYSTPQPTKSVPNTEWILLLAPELNEVHYLIHR